MRPLHALFALALLLAACATSAQPEPSATLAEPTPSSTPTEVPATPTTKPSPTAEPTLSPAARNYEWSEDEAVTVRADFTEEELAEKLRDLPMFPLVKNESAGTYGQLCILESISFLKENAYIRIDDFAITVTGQCTYLDVNRERQTITVALVVQNTVNKTQWMPSNRIMPGVTGSNFIQERFAQRTAATATGEITAGSRVSISFNRSNPNNLADFKASEHHGVIVDELYSPEMISEYINTGNPEVFESPLLVPFSAAKNQ